MKNHLNKMNRAAQNAALGTLLGNLEAGTVSGVTAGTTTASKAIVAGASRNLDYLSVVDLKMGTAGSETLDIQANVTTGTIKNRVKVLTGASATTASIESHKLFVVGDETGNTAYGMGDPAKSTTGLMACFGRTDLATGTMTDTAADFRVINKLVDNTGVHSMQGLYVKAKNYSGATLTGNLYGAHIECIPDGTVSGESALLKFGSDGTAVNRMIDATNLVFTEYTGGKVVVLLKFVDAAGATQYLIHNTDSATALSVTASAPS